MKSNKGYIIANLAAQFIVIPVLLSASLLTIVSGINSHSNKLALIILAFLGALLLGIIVGFIFSKVEEKKKPASAPVRYLTPLIPILYSLIFAVLAVVMAQDNYHSQWWTWYAFKNPFYLMFAIVVSFSGLVFVMPIAELMSNIGFVCGIFLQERLGKNALRSQAAGSLRKAFAALFVVVVLFLGLSNMKHINNGLTEILYGQSTIGQELTEYDLMRIAPFKPNNGLAKLGRQASLQFTDPAQMPRLDGATAAYPVYASFVEAVYKGLGDYYETNKNNGEKVEYAAFVAGREYPLNIVQCSKTSDAYERLIRGETDIIFVAEPSQAHIAAVQARGDEFVLTPIASEAFVFFTNINNPVDNLTIAQIQEIYSGNITNWRQVGGPNKGILPYQRPENSGSQTVMQKQVMKDVKMIAPTKETYAGGMGEIISRVAGYQNAKNALGYSFMYYSTAMIQNKQIKYLAVNGVKPTPETVRNKRYPFTVPVYAVTLQSNKQENIHRFIAWILSAEGQGLIQQTGYIPVKSY